MKGVTFGTKHSWNDFRLILSDKEIGFPEPKTETVDIPGMDGVLDLTETFGKVYYANRKLSFTFTILPPVKEHLATIDELTEYLHGKHMKIILDEDSDYYYEGRCKINSFKSDKTIGTIVIDCDVAPFKKAV